MDLSSVLTGRVRVAASGSVDPELAWRRYTEPAWWPVWSPLLREVVYPDAVVRAGTTGRVTGVGGVHADFRIDAVDHAARTWSWTVSRGPVRVTLEHGVDGPDGGSGAPSRHPGGSTAWLVVRAPWPVAAGYAPLAWWSLHRLVDG